MKTINNAHTLEVKKYFEDYAMTKEELNKRKNATIRATNNRLFVAGIIILFLLIINMIVLLSFVDNNTKKDLVYSTCQLSRQSNDISEQICGEMQDKYNLEFVCDDQGTSSNIKCKVLD
jgi:hypothetical protein